MTTAHWRNILLFLLGLTLVGLGIGDWHALAMIVGMGILFVVLVISVEF